MLQLHLHHDSFDDFLHVRNVNPTAGDQASPPLWIQFKQSELELLADETVAALSDYVLPTVLRETGALKGPLRAAVQELSNSIDQPAFAG